MAAIQQYEIFLRKYYNQGQGPKINPLPVSVSKLHSNEHKLKTAGSFLMASSQKESNAQVAVQNFAFNSS